MASKAKKPKASGGKPDDKAKAKAKARGKSAWKMVGSGSAVLGGIAMTKALDATWKTATGRKPPTKPESPEVTTREALLWSALSGMLIGVAKTYATRRAANYWVKSTGNLPPGMKSKAAKEQQKAVKKAASA